MARARTIAATALAVALGPSVASADPTQPGELVNPLTEAGSCEFCHYYNNPVGAAADPPYAPFRTWQGSMMANSARDPVFWAGVAVAAADMPGETELCVRCHAPRAFLEGNGAATSFDDLTNEQKEGVECELCHRLLQDDLTPAGNAQYEIDDVFVDTNVPRRGPWDYTDGVPEPPHTWIVDPYLGDSRACGTCHDVTTPVERVDDDGLGLGVDFNEQRTYSEWLGSAYAVPGAGFASCQDCHMPAVADMAGCTSYVNQHAHEGGGRRHDLLGANRFMLELLLAEYGSMGANLIPDAVFEEAIERTDAFLLTAATVELEAPAEVDLTVGLSGLAVTVTNNTGHKLPSGYSEGRIMWIEVLAEYAGQVVWSSGAWDEDAGIEQDAQLRTYEAVGEEYATGTTFHLLRNDHWRHDTRIPPLGLQPSLETDPVGDRYALLPEGVWPNYDEHTYDFAAAPEISDATPDDPGDDALLVSVRLRYLVNTREYIEFLGEQSGAGADVAATFEAAGGATPVLLGEASVAIPIVGFGSMPGTSTTGGSSSTGDGEDTVAPSTGTTIPGTTTSTTVPATTADTSDSETGSTGDTAGMQGEDGCGCRQTPGRGGWGFFVLVGLGCARSRRRRR